MWITDLLQAGRQTQDAQSSQNIQTAGREPLPAMLQKEIQALTPGQVLSGRILERSGEDLKLLVNFQGSEMELQARLEQNMALSMSKNILFQVKNNDTGLSLSPLFENMGMEANAQKAAQMASLPVNDTAMQLTGLLMKEGMPIDKESLQNFYHEVTTFADAQIMDIIDLHKLGIPVNAENLEQMSSYKNMTHQLMGGISELSQQLPQLLQEMSSQGLDQAVGRLLEALLLSEDGTPAVENFAQAAREAGQDAGLPEQEGQLAAEESRAEAQPGGRTIVITEETLRTGEGGSLKAGEDVTEAAEQENRAAVNPQSHEGSGTEQVHQQGNPQLLRQVAQALAQGRQLPIRELVRSPEFQRQLQEYVKQELSLRPEDTSKEKLDQVYSRLNRQLGALSEALGRCGKENSVLGKTVQNLYQNLRFPT